MSVWEQILVPNPRSEAQLRALVFVWIWTKQLRLPRDVAKLIGDIVRKDIVVNVGDTVISLGFGIRRNWTYENGNVWCEFEHNLRPACETCRLPCVETYFLCEIHKTKTCVEIACGMDCYVCRAASKYRVYHCPKH